MITVRVFDQNFEITPTMFPDGTSQVWKLPFIDSRIKEPINQVKIIWHFEQEAELLHIIQLIALMTEKQFEITELYIPYLPYGRQDKYISNTTTFARDTMVNLLPYRIKITTLDIHSKSNRIISYPATHYIQTAIVQSKSTCVVFPDNGAYERYKDVVGVLFPIIVLDKNRVQYSGDITSLKMNEELSTFEISESGDNERFIIVDDICDGGATFIKTANFLYSQYGSKIENVALYVTHGLFSKGFDNMLDNGITEFYTTQSLLRNPEGYSLREI